LIRVANRRLLGSTALLLATLLAMTSQFGCASSGSRKQAQARPRRTVLLTSADDVRVGADASQQVATEIGVLDDPNLAAYVEGIGQKLVRGLPRRDFNYHFAIVDQMEPNAFALPGGFIFVSRGLLALVNNEDELACVLGHEIVHVAYRHAAQQQEIARRQSPLSLPVSRASTMAAYSRDMEREADSIGQRICAAAGYDPVAMSTFMRSLDRRERLLMGRPRVPTWRDTHPGSRERAAENSVRASEMRWTRDPTLGDVRKRYLDRIDGLAIGDRPETGVFLGQLFVHPELDFQIRFPTGWQLQNAARAVGATAPRREAVVFLAGDLPPGELVEVANRFASQADQEFGARVTQKENVRLGNIEAIRYSFQGGNGPQAIAAQVTFFPFARGTWRMVAMSPRAASDRFSSTMLMSTRSFGPLTPENRERIEIRRLRVVLARAGEEISALGQRTQCDLDPAETASLNGLFGNEVFAGGELLKIVRLEGKSGP